MQCFLTTLCASSPLYAAPSSGPFAIKVLPTVFFNTKQNQKNFLSLLFSAATCLVSLFLSLFLSLLQPRRLRELHARRWPLHGTIRKFARYVVFISLGRSLTF